jgi:hypothetical protein
MFNAMRRVISESAISDSDTLEELAFHRSNNNAA